MKALIALLFVLSSFQTLAGQLVIHSKGSPDVYFNEETLSSQFVSVTFTTKLPWYSEEKVFVGVKVSDLLRELKFDNVTNITLEALNDYAAEISAEDINKYQPIIAYKMDGKAMQIRHKGPFWLVFDLSKYPEIDRSDYYSKMVWQIKEVTVINGNDKK